MNEEARPQTNKLGLINAGGGGPLARAVAGMRLAVSGLSFTLAHPPLRRWLPVPMVLNLIVFVALFWVGLSYLGSLIDWLSFGIPEESVWHFVDSILAVLVGTLLVVLFFVGGWVIAIGISTLLMEPLYDIVSERTEELLIGRRTASPFSIGGLLRSLGRELWLLVRRLSRYLLGLLVIALIGLIPLIGTAAAAVLGALWSWLFLALEFMTPSLSAHELPGDQRLKLVFRNKAACAGFGLVAWALLFIPLTLPFLVVGGTRLHLSLAAWDHAPARLEEADKARLRGCCSS